MKLRCGARTDVGQVREQNEDTYGRGPDDQAAQLGTLLVVCDGMGGHAAGEVASRLAVDTVIASYYADPREQRPEALEAAFVEANRAVYARGRGTMGTTGVAALLHHDALRVANVGDSRAYLLRNNDIRQITRDHSLVADQVAAGLLTPAQARVSMIKNVITRALGHQSQVSVDMFREPVQVGDIVLLCSDGLHGLVTDDELLSVARAHTPDDAAQRFIDLANERGGSDNITVVLLLIDALDWDAEPLDDATEVLHERVTEPLDQVTRPLTLETAAQIRTTPATPTLGNPQPTVPPAAPAPTERPLRMLGLVLSLLLFSVLLLTILGARAFPPSSTSTAVPAMVPTASAPSAVPAPSGAPTNPAPTSATTATP